MDKLYALENNIKKFNEDGFVIFKKVLCEKEVNLLKKYLHKRYSRSYKKGKYLRDSNIILKVPEISFLLKIKQIDEFTKKIFSENYKVMTTEYILRPNGIKDDTVYYMMRVLQVIEI